MFLLILIFNLIAFLITTTLYAIRPNSLSHPKKIAVCISGQLRDNWQLTISTIKKYIIDPYQADVFFSFNNDATEDTKNNVIGLLKPKLYKFEDFSASNTHSKYSRNFDIMINRLISCNMLKKQYEHKNRFRYDVVIRIRPDMVVKDSIDPHMLNTMQPNTVYFYEYNYVPVMSFYGATDQYFFSDSVTMDKVMHNKFRDVMQHIKQCKYSEYAVYIHVTNMGIKTKIFYSDSILYKYTIKDTPTLAYEFAKEKGVFFPSQSVCNAAQEKN